MLFVSTEETFDHKSEASVHDPDDINELKMSIAENIIYFTF